MNKGKLYQNIFDPEIVHSDLVKHMQGKMGQEMLDPTNTFALMLESIGESASEAVQASVAITRKVYPSLCTTSEDILRHATSDELIGLYASPSSTILSVYMNAIDVLNVGQASDISLDTRFVQMSKRTRFTVGGITFCSVNDVRIHYDGLSSLVEQVTSYDYGFNRYGSLNSYLIDDVDGGKWIKFDIPVRQFDYQIFESDVVGSYDARFPVIGQLWYTRAVGLFPDGERELAITHSDIVYDVAIPTLKITPLEGELKAHLPNIYLVNGTAPTKITLTIYGTHGAFNMNLREYVVGDYVVDRVQADVALNHVTTQVISGTIVTGGRDTKSISEVRRSIINNVTGELLSPLTFGQLQEKAGRDGYDIELYSDMVTNRLFVVNKIMDINMFTKIASNPCIFVNKVSLGRHTEDDPGHNVFYTSEGIVIKRESIMLADNGIVTPIAGMMRTHIESTYNQINGMTIPVLSAYLRKHRLFYTPYTNIIYPDNSCRTFELHEPQMDNLTIVNRNVGTPYRINVGIYEMYHIDKVGPESVEHYEIIVSLVGLDQIDLDILSVRGQLVIPLENGTRLHFDGFGTPTHSDPTMKFIIPTDSFVDKGGKINIYGGSLLSMVSVALRTDAYIIFYVPTNVNTGGTVYADENIIERPDDVIDLTGLTNHKITIEFGRHLPGVFNETTSEFTPRKYLKETADVPHFHESNVYEQDSEGCPTDVVLHEAGDVVTDEHGLTVFRTRVGDTVLVGGKPVIDKVQGVVVEANLLMFELEYLISMSRANRDAISIVKENIKQFLGFTQYISGNRLESTRFEYMPRHFAGSVGVFINGKNLRVPQIIRPKIELYVDTNMKFEVKKALIGRIIQQQIEQKVIVLDNIRKAITGTLGISAASIDLGINLIGGVENSYADEGTACGLSGVEIIKVTDNHFTMPKILMPNREIIYDIIINVNHV